MSAQTSMEDSTSGPAEPDDARGQFRAVALIAVCLGVAALAVATFVLSYAGIHTIALQAGIAPRYARGYPLLIDAMLVIVLAAVLVLRGAGLPSQILAWLSLLVVLAAAAGADALHATGHRLAHNAAAITAAVLPWALVLLAFVLLLTMLRHARLRRQASVRSPSVRIPQPRVPLALPPAPPPPPRPGSPQPDAGLQSQRPPDLSQINIGQPAPIPPLTPQQGQADSAPLPVRTPQPWSSASIVPGFSRHLASAAAAGAAAAEFDLAPPEAEDAADQRGSTEPEFGPDDDGWGYSPEPETTAEPDAGQQPGSTELADSAEPAYAPALTDASAMTDQPWPTDEPALTGESDLAYDNGPAYDAGPADDNSPAYGRGATYDMPLAGDIPLADGAALADTATYQAEDAATAGPQDAATPPEDVPPDQDDTASESFSPAPTTFDLVPGEASPDDLVADEPAVALAEPDFESGGADLALAQPDAGSGEAAEEDDMPVFHRMWSSPTPPES